MIRKILFWLHLAAGCLAGVVILIMSFTGVLLAWQRQITHWQERDLRHAPATGQKPMAPEDILAVLQNVPIRPNP